MKENEESAIPGRVLVEPIEFVDLREIAKGKHGSHRASPERDIPMKKGLKDVQIHQDHSYNCLQIALQENKISPGRDGSVHKEVSPRIPTSKTPSKDEVLSVVIQKLTELVKNSEQKQKDDLDSNIEDGEEDEHRSGKSKHDGRTKLYQCPNCPCLFAVQKHKVGQLCSCCLRDSRCTSPEEIEEEYTPEAHCLRDGQDHGGIACDICIFKAQTYDELLYHLATHNANIFRCKFCNFVTTKHAAIESHQSVHMVKNEKKCVCNICGYKTSDFSSLQVHIKKEHQSVKEILLKCSVCGYSTRSESGLRDHMWGHVNADRERQPQSQKELEIRRHKSSSPSRSETEERKELKKTVQSAVEQDMNTKLFKCLLCGYLCEKLSTLKAHAWRHAGQEGCSYPVMHKLQDASEILSGEDSTNHNSETGFSYVEVTEEVEIAKFVRESPRRKQTKEKGKCQCSPIMLPEEEHGIVQKVFADATTVDPENESNTSPTTLVPQDHCAASSTVSVIKRAPEITKDCSQEDERLCNSLVIEHQNVIGHEQVSDTSYSHVMPLSVCDVLIEEVVTTANEEIAVKEEDMILAQLGLCDAITETEKAQKPAQEHVESDGEEGKGEKRHSRNQKRKVPCSSPALDSKKICTKPGISKMLLSAVDDALQVRREMEKINQDRSSSDPVKAKESIMDAVATVTSMQNSENSSVQTHVCSQGSTPVFKCQRCPATFWHPQRLQHHMDTHEAILKCSDCSLSCSSEIALRDHVKKVHLTAKSTICPTCHKEVKNESPKDHEQTCVLKCWYGCRECDYVVSSMEELQAHCQKTHQKPYKCGMCNYSSATANGIKNHMKFHNADKPYKCNLCDFSGAYPQSLRSHMKKHSTSSPSLSSEQYKCKFCPYISGHLPSMKSHMWRHTSHPGYDYDGQDIIKMVVKVEKCNSKGKDQQEKLSEVPTKASIVDTRMKDKAEERKKKSAVIPSPDKPKDPPNSKQIQYGSVIFQCSQCGFKSNDHSCLVEHLREHLANIDNSGKS
ncbi:zinc finger protein 507-like [Lytechinus pictus]|uniref:zinc finger protein 507-like n=1 Tax=Lytechinus pictus TaxID=7653 RepID=UPI0030B9CBAB